MGVFGCVYRCGAFFFCTRFIGALPSEKLLLLFAALALLFGLFAVPLFFLGLRSVTNLPSGVSLNLTVFFFLKCGFFGFSKYVPSPFMLSAFEPSRRSDLATYFSLRLAGWPLLLSLRASARAAGRAALMGSSLLKPSRLPL